MEKYMVPKTENFRDLDEIEKDAVDMLEQLTQLEGPTSVQQPLPHYMNILKEMQIQMKEKILNGIQTNNRELFLKGLELYEQNYSILSSVGDNRVSEDYQHEIIQFLTDLIVQFKREISDPIKRYFIIISLQFVAKIYEDAQNFNRAVEIRLTVSNLLNSWEAAIEYAAIILNYLLSDQIERADAFLNHFDSLESKIFLLDNTIIEQSLQSKRILALKEFSENLITGTVKELPIFFNDAQEILDHLALTEYFSFSRVLTLFTSYLGKMKVIRPLPDQTHPSVNNPPTNTNLIVEIKNFVAQSIESSQNPHRIDSFDTGAIITELKQFISTSIKNLSQDIINNIGKFTVATSSTHRRSSSPLLDDSIPEIKVTTGLAPDEKPKRPKLSDVLDSIVVSD